MAPVALLICVIFIAWLLARDSRRRPSVSAAIWIPTLMVLTFGSRTPSEWLGARAVSTGLPNDAAGSAIDQIFFFSIMFASWIIASRRGVKWTRLFSANAAIMLFYAYFAISFLWSADPSGSFKRVLKDFGSTVFVVSAILSEKDPFEAIRAIYVRCACVLFPLSILLIKYYAFYGRVYARNGDATFNGVTTQKNSLGEVAMVCSLFLVLDHRETITVGAKRVWRRTRWDLLVLLLMGVWLLNLSESKTSLVCFLVGLALIFSRRRFASRMTSGIVFVCALSLPFILFSTQQFNWLIAPILGALGRDLTFTGRSDIWQHITSTTVNPLVGAGFWNFWGGEGGRAISEAMRTGVPNAHDGYLDMYLDGGVIGLVLLFILLFTSGKRLIGKLHENRYQQMRFAFLIVAIVANLTESNFARPSFIWFTTMLVLLEFPVRKPSPIRAKAIFDRQPQERDSDGSILEVTPNRGHP
jgi:exopolysaccharide production protein ExoQ